MPWYRMHLRVSGLGGSLVSASERKLDNDKEALAWYGQVDDERRANESKGFFVTKPTKLLRIDVRESSTDITPGDVVSNEESG